MALNNLGNRYSELGRRQEALAPTEEAVRIRRELAKTNPAFLNDLAGSLNNLGLFQLALGQPEQARSAYAESIAIIRPLAANNPAFQQDLQRTLNNLEELNRKEGIRTGAKQVLGAADVSYLPQNDPTTPVKRSVVRLWPTFAGKKTGIGLLGTGFVVRREGDRAWIATALHVVRDPDDYGIATKVEAELFTGPLPAGLLPPRLEVVRVQVPTAGEAGEDLIVLELRGLPPDVQPLPLSAAPPQGSLTVVGHPSGSDPWSVGRYPLLKATPILLLEGRLEQGASGSPVLTPAGQVVGLVYRSSGEGEPVPLVYAYPARSIQGKLP
jgi:superkiller protein 3